MSKLRFNISMSLDGFVAGPDQTLEEPLGVGGEDLHEWAVNQKTFHEMHGGSGGETGTNDDILRETFDNIGATIMGRNMFGGGPGPWKGDAWKGWWGDEPPYHTAAFVLTHHAREPLVMEGGTTFYFITDGIESALEQAKKAAGKKDVLLGGGAKAAQQYLAAGLIDEMELHIAPILLGAGERLFDNVDSSGLELELVRTVAGPGVTHVKYVVSPQAGAARQRAGSVAHA